MREGTGRIRRIVNDSTAATETYIAHNLPDKTVAAVTPIGLCVLIFAFNWKIGLFCMIPAVIGFLCMMSMMGKGMQEKMAEYQNALEAMSAEATEYVRGIPVVKTFGQTVNSFTRFKSMIDNFGKWATDYTLMLRGPRKDPPNVFRRESCERSRRIGGFMDSPVFVRPAGNGPKGETGTTVKYQKTGGFLKPNGALIPPP